MQDDRNMGLRHCLEALCKTKAEVFPNLVKAARLEVRALVQGLIRDAKHKNKTAIKTTTKNGNHATNYPGLRQAYYLRCQSRTVVSKASNGMEVPLERWNPSLEY